MKTLRISMFMAVLMLANSALFAEAPVVKTDIPAHPSRSGFTCVVIDMAQIIDQKNPANSKAESWTESFKTLTSGLDKEQQALQKLQSEVEEEYKKIEAKQKEGTQPTKEETTKIQSMFQELQSKNQQLSEKAQREFAKLQEEFKKKVDDATEAVKIKKGFAKSVKVADKMLFYGYREVDEFDITADVVAELNAKHAAEKRAKKMACEPVKPAAKAVKAA